MTRLFGTDGIRGVAGEFPLDKATVEAVGWSLGINLGRQVGRPARIIIGRDTRESGPAVERAIANGARAAGAYVRSAGVITTPGVAYVTRAEGFDAGVVISASHNPFGDNGIKVFAPDGKKMTDEMERLIESDVASLHPIRIDEVSGDELKPDSRYVGDYIDYLSLEVGSGVDLEGVAVGIDCANGAAYNIAPQVLTRLNARVSIIAAEPDGCNINRDCGSLHTEGLRSLVINEDLDLGVALDGDADRALFVDDMGRLVDGDQILAALAADMKRNGGLANNIVVATVMSNIGLEIALRDLGIELIRTPVGDRFVLDKLLETGAIIGGEQSGHIIFPEISLAGDGIITAIELLKVVRRSGLPLSALVDQMKKFPQVLINVRVRSKPPLDSIDSVRKQIERLEKEINGRGRLLVRYSGTENLARVMIEGEDQATITRQAEELAETIEASLGVVSSS